MNKTYSEGFHVPEILIVDDEPAIVLGLKRQLTGRGYDVRTASNGAEALQAFEDKTPDLVILDLMMPEVDGLQVTHAVRMRLHSDVPIIVLSARGEEQQKVQALDLGADDYLTKPFGLDELLARVRVALRRQRQHALYPPEQAASPGVVSDEHLTIDLAKHMVWRDGNEVKLTPKQYELLKYLALNPQKLITHKMLLHAVWGSEYKQETQYLHVFIGQLRQKLEPNPARPRYILTEPGLGYRFRLPGSSE